MLLIINKIKLKLYKAFIIILNALLFKYFLNYLNNGKFSVYKKNQF